jgi:ABC-type phosphate transport system substrate-binding protein
MSTYATYTHTICATMKRRIGLTFTGLVFISTAGTAAAEVVAVVGANSPVTSLTKSQVINIFLGKSNRFPDGSLAVPIDQKEGSTERNKFYASYANMSAAQIKSHWSKIIFTGRGQPPKEVANGAEVKKRIAANPNTIGYLEDDLVDDSMRVLLAP